jgi:hypothetical protein
MNIFRLCGDMSHLGAIIILLLKMWKTRSVAGKNFVCAVMCCRLFGGRSSPYFQIFFNVIICCFGNILAILKEVSRGLHTFCNMYFVAVKLETVIYDAYFRLV